MSTEPEHKQQEQEYEFDFGSFNLEDVLDTIDELWDGAIPWDDDGLGCISLASLSTTATSSAPSTSKPLGQDGLSS
jgi:hypothetical protein